MTERDRQRIEETGGVYPTNNGGVGDEGVVIGVFVMIIVFVSILFLGLSCK